MLALESGLPISRAKRSLNQPSFPVAPPPPGLIALAKALSSIWLKPELAARNAKACVRELVTERLGVRPDPHDPLSCAFEAVGGRQYQRAGEEFVRAIVRYPDDTPLLLTLSMTCTLLRDRHGLRSARRIAGVFDEETMSETKVEFSGIRDRFGEDLREKRERLEGSALREAARRAKLLPDWASKIGRELARKGELGSVTAEGIELMAGEMLIAALTEGGKDSERWLGTQNPPRVVEELLIWFAEDLLRLAARAPRMK